jgi:thioredoxin reductase (NADPH)
VDKVISLMQAQGTRFLMKNEITKIEKLDTGKLKVDFINLENKSTHTDIFDTVLYAVGRGADTQGLNLSSTGVKFTSSGTIITDQYDRTNIPHIYAVGDVADSRPELTPVAIQAGELLSRRLFDNSSTLMNYHGVPTTVFTPFEYGRVGMSEEDAITQYGAENIEVFLSEFSTLEIGAAHRKRLNPPNPEEPDFPTNCLSKLICHKSDKNRIIGFHYVGPNAGEITQGFALALKVGATKEDFNEVVGIHPTDAESFMSLGITKSSKEVWEYLGGCGGGKCG